MRSAWFALIAIISLAVAACSQQPASSGNVATNDTVTSNTAVPQPIAESPASVAAVPEAPTVIDAAPAAPPQALPPTPALSAAADLIRQGDALNHAIDARGERLSRSNFNHADAPAEAWQDPDQGMRVVSGQKTYYYKRGETEPYLAQDNGATYAFKNGAPTAVLGRDGQPVSGPGAMQSLAQAKAAVAEGRALRMEVDKQPPKPSGGASPEHAKPDPAGEQNNAQGRRERDRNNGSGTGGPRG